MTQSEDITNGKTLSHTKTSTKSYKGQTSMSSGQGERGDIGKTRNNTGKYTSSTKKYYKG